MTIEPAPDGWVIEYRNRYYHVNQKWLDEQYRHQVKPYGNNPAFNLLEHGFQNGADADEIGRLFTDYQRHRKQARGRANTSAPDTPFQEFIRGRRNENANRNR